jgi:hypothetical protein
VLQVVDKDGDTATASLQKLVIIVDDDSPVIVAPAAGGSFNATYANADNPAPGGSGYFSYAIGFDDRDTYASNSTDLLVTFTGGSVGGTAITNRVIGWDSEDDTQATFDFSFTYVSDPTDGTTTNAAGTLIFDKNAGTYHIELTEPVSSFSVISLADAGVGFTGYALNSAVLTGSQPPVTVAALDDDFFVQFTGAQETGGGTDGNSASQQNSFSNNHNLDAFIPTNAVNRGWTNPGDDAFVDGELFTQSSTWVSVSGIAAGVAGDTMQAGEVLDFNFFKDNPQGFLSPAVDMATTSTIFIKFDGLDNGEDLVVLLKLVNKDDPSITTTRAVIVQYDDIFHKAQAGDIPVDFGFTGTLDNNDGLVVIERNDYNVNVGDNWTIQGAQVLASTEVGIDLNRAVGVNGGSTLNGTDPFNTVKDSGGNNGGTWDGDVFKIVNIGFFTETTPDAQLTFSVTVVDFDGDTSGAQTLTVDILGDSSASATQQVVNLLEVPEPGLFLM